MDLIRSAGITPGELALQVDGDRWRSWCVAEPVLMPIESLDVLRHLHGAAEDQPLGALVRLAAVDGGDDELAAVAVVHQVEHMVAALIRDFDHLAPGEIEGIVVGALWQVIRTFPWQRRRRSYGACLLLSTRRDLVELLLPDYTAGLDRPVVSLEPGELDLLSQSDDSCSEPAEELRDFLNWALALHALDLEQQRLLLELVRIDTQRAQVEGPRSFGSCSSIAASTLAKQAGVSAKTVRRARDRALASLRLVVPEYVAAVSS